MAQDTKETILNIAEILFSEQGIGNTSLRNITSSADVNLAAVNYHFGSKDGLIEAVFYRRLIPMNEDRIARLDALNKHYPEGGIPLEELIEAFIGPPLELSRDRRNGGAVFVQLLGRTYTEPTSVLQETLRRMYEPAIERFRHAFSLALPELSMEELYWRMHFMVGLLAYLMSGTDMMRLVASSKLQDSNTTEILVERVKLFLAAGMRSSSENGTSVDSSSGKSVSEHNIQ